MSNNWYISKNAAGLNNGSNWTNAWKEMDQVVWTGVAGGDNIWMAGYTGFYTGTLTMAASGGPNNFINLLRVRSTDSIPIAAAGWQPSFDSTVMISGQLYSVQYSTTNAGSYTSIDGRIRSGIKIIVTTQTGATAGGGIKFLRGATNVNFGNIEIAGPDTPGHIQTIADDRGIDTTAYNGVFYELVQNLNITGCDIHGCCDLMYLCASGVNIQHNHFYDSIAPAPAHANILISFGASGVTFANNEISNWISEGILMNPSPGVPANGIWNVYNNLFHDVIFDVSTAGGRCLETQYNLSGPVYYFNNTMVNVWSAESAGGWATGSSGVNNIYCNVSVFNNTSPNIVMGLPYNDYARSDIALPTNTGTQNTHSFVYPTPPFVNYAGKNYHIVNTMVSGNPVGAGINFSTIFQTDLDNNARPGSGPWDIGAYQFLIYRLKRLGAHLKMYGYTTN